MFHGSGIWRTSEGFSGGSLYPLDRETVGRLLHSGNIGSVEMEHRLAAIVAADMVGYSRLMEVDERGTLARLRTHRIELIDPVIERNHGRIIKTTGDGLLIEFHSVTDAVRSSIEIQERLRRRNSDVPDDRRIEFRIGSILATSSSRTATGDGVNIAARIEQLAEVGGICVTSAVHTQVDGRLEVAFEDLGEKSLKNITRPVRVYRVLLGGVDGKAGSAPKPAVVKPTIAVLPFAIRGRAYRGHPHRTQPSARAIRNLAHLLLRLQR